MPEDRSGADRSGFDRALDGALAELTAAPPPDELRRRVLARLSAPDRETRGLRLLGVRWTVTLPAAATVVVLTWAGFWLTHRESAGSRPARPPATAAVSPVPGPAPSAVGLPPTPAAPLIAPRTTPRAIPQGRTVERARTAPAHARAEAVADDVAALPPLAPPPPVQVAALTVTEVSEPPPLEVPRLRIDPLSPPETNGSDLP